MAKLAQYRQIIQKIFTEYRDWAASGSEIGSNHGVQECVNVFPLTQGFQHPSKRPLTEFAVA